MIPFGIYIVLFFTTALSIIVPFSGQLTITPLFVLFTNAHSAIAIATVIFLISAVLRIVMFWKFIQREYVKALLPISILGAIVGAFALVKIPANVLLIILFVFCAYYLNKTIRIKFSKKSTQEAKENKHTVAFVGLFSGFLQGAGLAGSDLRNNYLYSKKLTISEVHGTTAVMGGSTFLFATIVRVLEHQISIGEISSLVAVFLPIMAVATYLGKKILIKIPKNISDWIVIIVMTIGTLAILYKILTSF